MIANARPKVEEKEHHPLATFDDARVIGKHFMSSHGPYVLSADERLEESEPFESSWYRTTAQAEDAIMAMTRIAGGNLLSIKSVITAKVGPRTYYRIAGCAGLYSVPVKVPCCDLNDSKMSLINKSNRFSSKFIMEAKAEKSRLTRQDLLIKGGTILFKGCIVALALTFCWGTVQFAGEQ